MGAEWDQHVAVTRLGAGSYAAELTDGWRVGGGINGGYQLAVVGTALSKVVPGRPDPLAISAYFLSAATHGPATVDARVLREGGSVATLAADLRQGDQARLSVLATYGDLAGLPDDVRTTATPPDLPPVEECVSNRHAPEEVRSVAPLMERFDMRFDPRHVGWVVGQPSGNGEMQAWFRLVEDREPDPMSLLMVVDALPPVTYDLGMAGWAPTLELTAHVRACPAPGWLQVRHATRNVAGGMFEEDCEVWDSSGRLVAQSRQLARVPR
ncbi:acyl-CoA thioesterase [Nocardioides coralli]|uniref:acyl-CoA thioesterase n=1 Tax=Nocardioides coralli TaxID=2872154 RepID=UPI001CA42CFF|nr:thioesterase family protein [Nocardioides coralli]QZY28483.1 thioesterase family protein [Nocardioides coralli]